MLVTLAHIANRSDGKSAGSSEKTSVGKATFDLLTRLYIDRCQPWARVQSEAFRSEVAFVDWLTKQRGRAQAVTVLLDSRGRQISSEAFAAWIGARRDEGAQHLVFAIGPPDGWSGGWASNPADSTQPATLAQSPARPQLLLSLGPMTLPHALARVVLAEQIYRAYAILHNHPYHCGH